MIFVAKKNEQGKQRIVYPMSLCYYPYKNAKEEGMKCVQLFQRSNFKMLLVIGRFAIGFILGSSPSFLP